MAVGYCFSTLGVIFTGNTVFDALNNTVINFIGTQNGLFFAFPYVALGSFISEKNFIPKYRRDISFSVLFFILLGVEAIFAVKVVGADKTFLWLSALPMTYFIFRLMYTIKTKPSKVYYTIRKISTMNYVCHILLLTPIAMLISKNLPSGFDSLNLIYFVSVSVFTTLISYFLVRLSKLKTFEFLKYIM